MSKLEDVTKLLEEEYVSRPESDPVQEEERDEAVDEGTETEEVQEETRYSVKDLAAKLEVQPKDLYKSLDIKLSDGSTMSLSELKDLAVKGKHIDEHTVKRDKDANELMVQRKEINDVMELLTTSGKVTEDMINKVREQNDMRMASEMKLLLKALPDWESQSVRNKEVKAIGDYARQYGITPTELDALITDHRLMKLIRDVATKPVSKPKDIAPIRKAMPKAQVTSTNNMSDKLNKISELIN